ncbi:MAG: PqqD family protein [Pyrinomonadaceae bacterium]
MATTNIPATYEHIVSTAFDGGEGVLVDLNTKRYYQLNETAMLVWHSLEKSLSIPEIVREMTATYEVSENHAANSIEKVLRELQTYRLVRPRS